jgi:parvulin-like peptidyl-prolyl isomerase
MKKLAAILLSATLLSSTVLAEDAKILGTYDGGNVTEKQIMTQFKPMLEMQAENKGKNFDQLDKNLQKLLVRGYINQKLLEKEGDKSGIKNSQDFKDKLKIAESQILQQILIEKHLKTSVTDAMISADYDELVKNLQGKKEVKASHILVDTEDKAKEVKKKLDKGSKFESLVKEFSKDEGSKENGGELGYVMKGQLVPEFESKAFSMKNGEVSDPVKTQFGWHIIKVLDSRPVQIPSKDEAKESIKAKLSRMAIEKYFSDLAEKENVKINIE